MGEIHLTTEWINLADMNNPTISELADAYDVVVVGGGIQGCGCAQAFAAASYTVLLIEQNELGTATSSRSSKLIHGGLRYLETGQFSLVRKSLTERALLCKLAPELVKLKPFYLPVYQQQRLTSWRLFAGLCLYSALGNFSPASRFNRLPRSSWSSLAGLSDNKLVGVYRYQDAQTDDQLLTLAVANSARQLGATIVEHCQLYNATLAGNGDHININIGKPAESKEPFEITATLQTKLIVNAGGPWVTQVQESIDFATEAPEIALVQGAHIELDQPLSDGIFYVESPVDQRAVFIMPWQDRTLVGTTERAYVGDPTEALPSDEEIDYLLITLHHYFPDYNGKLINQWAGLRVLPKPTATSPSTLRPFSSQARDTMIHCDNEKHPRLISLYGGKLTAYRVTSEQVVAKARQSLGNRIALADTANLELKMPTSVV